MHVDRPIEYMCVGGVVCVKVLICAVVFDLLCSIACKL